MIGPNTLIAMQMGMELIKLARDAMASGVDVKVADLDRSRTEAAAAIDRLQAASDARGAAPAVP